MSSVVECDLNVFVLYKSSILNMTTFVFQSFGHSLLMSFVTF